MRPIILLLLAGLAYAQYADPPLALVAGNNSAAAAALDGYFNESYAQNGTITLRFGDYSQSPNISASLALAGLSPSIDNVSCAMDGMALSSARGYDAGPLVSIPYEGYPDFSCDRAWHDSNPSMPLRCDFDGDDCSEYVNRTIVQYDLNATFILGDRSVSAPLTSTWLILPPEAIALMANASGSDNLTVNVSGNVTFIYEVNDQRIEGMDCVGNYTNFSSSIPMPVNRTFTVGGWQKLFFLAAPVLREQWFRDNRFDVVVLSQCPLYLAQIALNNASARNMTLRSFNITKDWLNFSSMVSLPAKPDGWLESANKTASPVPLEAASNSFAFAYRFDFAYMGLGENNLSLSVRDSALSWAQYNETLLSRMVSSGGVTETGQDASLVPSRPSAGFEYGSLTHLEISLGLVGLVLILAFLNFWVPR